MEKQCIFKACKGNKWWYLYRCKNVGTTKGYVYRVYCGRKWYDKISWFDYENAMDQLLECCLGLGVVVFGRTRV